MLESFLKAGKQTLHENQTPDPDLSVTDACISFEETEKLILRAHEKLVVVSRFFRTFDVPD